MKLETRKNACHSIPVWQNFRMGILAEKLEILEIELATVRMLVRSADKYSLRGIAASEREIELTNEISRLRASGTSSLRVDSPSRLKPPPPPCLS